MSRIIKCWVSGLILILAGYLGAAWGAFKEGTDYEVLDTPCTDHSLVTEAQAVGKISVLKFYSLTCIPCFLVEDELYTAAWLELRQKIQLKTVHRLKEKPAKASAVVTQYSEWDYPFVIYHYALTNIADGQYWEGRLLYDTLKRIHQQLMSSDDEKNRLRDPVKMATFLRQWNLPGFNDTDFRDQAMNDDFLEDEIRPVATGLYNSANIASIPAFVVGGKYKVERSKHITEKIQMTPADITKMLKIVEHLVGLVQAETS
ncbi:hypothetical protein ACWJJH_02900 [Endozoicomonadaceae bacterium StTr2]